MTSIVEIRRTAPADFELLEELTVRSRRHWGYDAELFRFYEKLGGRHVREETSHSFGHRLPVMRLDLAAEPGSAGGVSAASR